AEHVADAEDDLRAPDILKPVGRRSENTERVEPPEQREVKRDGQEHGHDKTGSFTHAFLLQRKSGVIALNANFKRNRGFTLPGPALMASLNLNRALCEDARV